MYDIAYITGVGNETPNRETKMTATEAANLEIVRAHLANRMKPTRVRVTNDFGQVVGDGTAYRVQSGYWLIQIDGEATRDEWAAKNVSLIG